MTFYQYVGLSLKERADYLWQHGSFIANGHDGVAPSAFYSLHDWFVEVVIDNQFDTIITVAPFKEGDRYERLLSFMDVPNVLAIYEKSLLPERLPK